jgi:hypothetical protein
MGSTARLWIVAWAIAFAEGGCGSGDSDDGDVERSRKVPAGEWTKLSLPPILGRVEALVAAVGDSIIVAGGWKFVCPPGADCVVPSTPPYSDGAAYDRKTSRWRTIVAAPVAFRSAATVVVDDDVYALIQCAQGPTCPSGRGLLRYRSEEDAWDSLPGPEPEGEYRLVRVAGGFVAFSYSDEREGATDYRFLASEDRWMALPADPLPPAYDRWVVEYDGRYFVFGTPLEGNAKTKIAAALDPEIGEWQVLAESRTLGYQVWRAGSLIYVNPHFGSGGGGIYDPSEDTWRPLPEPPYYDLAGIIADDGATYEYASGWVLDTRTGTWLSIEPRPDSSEVSEEVVVAGADASMIVFGGQTWETGKGQLLNETWIWTPPSSPAHD